jgi:predicted DNA-binding transcriptional regulator AlpA
LEEVAADPTKTGELDAHTTELLENAAITALYALRNRRLRLATEGHLTNTTRRHDRLLKAKEVAQRLGVHVYWVYHNQHKLPFRVRLGTVPRFSEIGLEEFIRSRLGT